MTPTSGTRGSGGQRRLTNRDQMAKNARGTPGALSELGFSGPCRCGDILIFFLFLFANINAPIQTSAKVASLFMNFTNVEKIVSKHQIELTRNIHTHLRWLFVLQPCPHQYTIQKKMHHNFTASFIYSHFTW